MTPDEVRVVDPNSIEFDRYADGSLINPRGPVRNTTDLEVSIAQTDNKFIDMPLCYEVDGRIICLDGHRRITLARIQGWKGIEIRIKKDFDPAKARRYMLATSTREAYPDIVLDANGVVIGGICKAIVEELRESSEAGKPITFEELARLIGDKTPDVISAYVALYDAPIEVKRKVASGKMAITVFSLVKHASQETQLDLVNSVEPEQRLTADKVRAELQKKRGVAPQGKPAGGVDSDGMTPVAMLNLAKSLIKKAVDHPDFDPRCEMLLEQIVDLAETVAI
jgi:hypothetical protein